MKRTKIFKRTLILFLLIIIAFSANLSAQTLQEIESHAVSLPNGWRLTPVGKLLPLGDLPLNIAVSLKTELTGFSRRLNRS